MIINMEFKQEDQEQYIGSLIQEGFYDKLVIIGYPYDQGASKCGQKRGQDYGPGKDLELTLSQIHLGGL